MLQNKYIGWDINLNGSRNANKVVSLGNTPPQLGTTSRTVAGYPIAGLWAIPITGYQDKNGDGLITWFADATKNELFTGDSAIYRGYATPPYQATLTNGLDFFNKKLRFTSLWDYRGGNKWYNNTERIRCTRPNCSGRLNLQADFIDQAANIAANESSARTLDGYFQPGSFLKLREMSVLYTLDPNWASRLARARSVSLVLSARNVKLWTKYRGTDPESGFNTTGNGEAPQEFQTIGIPSYFIFRVNLGY